MNYLQNSKSRIASLFRSAATRKIIFIFGLAIVLTASSSVLITYKFAYSAVDSATPKVIYSLDKRENDKELIKLIDEAQEYVYFAVYYFTHRDIADALIRAKRRGLIVEGITDKVGLNNAPNQAVFKLLRSAGIIIGNQKHLDGIMHIKVLVTEKAYASGSYNWTQAATEANDEVLEIGYDERIRSQYLDIIKKVLDVNKIGGGNNGDQGGSGEVVKIDFTEATSHIGEYAEVTGELIKTFTSGSGTTFLSFCKTTKCPFSAVIFASDSSKFKNLKKLIGPVKISGIIKSYRGAAEMILNSPDQVVAQQ